jgi:SSS family solute:Na+ symporter
MNSFDWFIIIVYGCVMIGLSIWIGRRQTSNEDYFVGGRNLPWWAVGLSTMATQTSAISFISIPAFVALKPGGGLTWLQYELAVPLAMIMVIVFLIPFFRKLKLISVYGYLENRFNPSVRNLVSMIFLISRGLGTGVGFNLILWLGFPNVYWMWWNAFGFLVTAAVSLTASPFLKSIIKKDINPYVLRGTRFFKEERGWLPVYAMLILYFLLLLAVLMML